MELCGCESFDDGHRSAALGTAPQRVRCRRGQRFRFVFRWSGVESGEASWQQGGAPSVGVYIDEIPVTTFTGEAVNLKSFDVERLEVLRGPQGTACP